MVGKPKPSKPSPRPPGKPTPHPLHVPINISFKLYKPGTNYCLSNARQDQIKSILDSLRVFTTMTWQQVRDQGGKPGNKAGLAYTLYPDHLLTVERPTNISLDLRMAAFRAGSGERVYGVSIESVFHVIWFDLNHEICKD